MAQAQIYYFELRDFGTPLEVRGKGNEAAQLKQAAENHKRHWVDAALKAKV